MKEDGLEFDYNDKYVKTFLPGEFPYTSGLYPNMYKEKSWNIKQYAGYGNAESANLNFKKLINSGSSGISIAFDLPTQMGIAPESNLAKFEVGRIGVFINTLDDMRILLQGINLKDISTSMTINASAGILLLMYQIVAEENGIDANQLRGTIQNDLLKEFITRSTYIFPPRPSMRFTNDIFGYCAKELPKWNPISVSGYHFSEAGANASQEVGFAISNGVYYLESALSYGLDIEKLAEKFTFFFSAKTNLLEEIAKFRAARTIWAKILKNKFNFSSPKSLQMRIHAQTAGSQLCAFGIENNQARVTIQALAAIFGGVQSLHTNSYNEALSLPTENSSKLAINIQHIIKEETDITFAPDPMRGSYVVENLTSKIELEVLDIIQNIEDLGGVINAIESGYQRSLIENSSYQEAKDLADNKKKIVGFNIGATLNDDLGQNPYFTQGKDMSSASVNIATSIIEKSAFSELKKCAQSDKNVMYPIKDLIKQGASVSEISDSLRECWGTYNN